MRSARRSRQDTVYAGRRIHANRHACLSHPCRDEFGGLFVFGSQVKPRQPVGLRRNRRQRVKHRLGTLAERKENGIAHWQTLSSILNTMI